MGSFVPINSQRMGLLKKVHGHKMLPFTFYGVRLDFYYSINIKAISRETNRFSLLVCLTLLK